MSNYLIKLTPVGKYFFGGDMTFPVGKEKKPENWKDLREEKQKKIEEEISFNTRYSSYIIESEKFPQQTSLLGMLRFFLLRNTSDLFENGGIVKDKQNEVEELIGPSSFPSDNYGIIECIHPCFLMKDGVAVTRVPMDNGFNSVVIDGKTNGTDDGKTKILHYNGNSVNLSTLTLQNVPYSAKDYRETYYRDENKNTYKEDAIFIKDQRIGINRNIETGITEDNSLFKQVNYRLADGFCFAFYAVINKEISETIISSPQIVSIGADSSQFVIELKKIDGGIPELPALDTSVDLQGCASKVVLVSPAFIEKEAEKMPDFAITETIPFKYMQTNVKETKSYHRLSGIKHSERVELFQTGSVFYFNSEDSANAFGKKLEEKTDYRKIGYNYYKNVKK